MRTFLLITMKRSFWILLALDTLAAASMLTFGLTVAQTMLILVLGILTKGVATLRGAALANPKLLEEANKEDVL